MWIQIRKQGNLIGIGYGTVRYGTVLIYADADQNFGLQLINWFLISGIARKKRSFFLNMELSKQIMTQELLHGSL
jgi:hypothetical protein